MEVLTRVVLRYANEELWGAEVFMMRGCSGKILAFVVHPRRPGLGLWEKLLLK
jgi:hypothetical protein